MLMAGALGIPETAEFHLCIPLGYPRGNFGPTQRRPTAETTFFNRWDAPVPWAGEPSDDGEIGLYLFLQAGPADLDDHLSSVSQARRVSSVTWSEATAGSAIENSCSAW